MNRHEKAQLGDFKGRDSGSTNRSNSNMEKAVLNSYLNKEKVLGLLSYKSQKKKPGFSVHLLSLKVFSH